MLKFLYDRVLDRQNICNLKQETEAIETLISANYNVVLYAPRNFGKTSLVKSIIIPDFKKRNPKSFVYFVDLMGVKDMESLVGRLNKGLENALKDSFSLKSLLENTKSYLKNLRPDISLDLVGGVPQLKLATYSREEKLTIADIFQVIANIAKKHKSLIVLDEFQDIAFIEEAEALLRDVFQNLDVPIIVLGSKKHLLGDIFAKPRAPLANFGHDVFIKPIDYQEYQKYMNQRFKQKGNKINLAEAKFLQDATLRVPEAINMLCYEIDYSHKNKEIDKDDIMAAFDNILNMRQARFESLIKNMTKAEEEVLKAIADIGGKVRYPTAKDFISRVNLTPRTVALNIKKLLDNGFLEQEDGTYCISDAFLMKYLQNYR